MRFQMTFFAAIVAVGMAAPGVAAAQGIGAAPFAACPDPTTVPDVVPTPCVAIASFDSAVSRSDRAAIVRSTGAIIRFNFSIVDAAAVLVPNEGAYWALSGDPSVTAFVPDRRVVAFGPPNGCTPWPDCKNGGGGGGGGGGGSLQPVPSGVARIGADQVWGTWDGTQFDGISGKGVTAWILDSGIDSSHPDLGNYDSSNGVSCLGDGVSATVCGSGGEDDYGHGTHVAGIVGATYNDIDVVGVAPEVTLESVKVLDSSGSGYDSNVIAGLDYVAGHPTGADVVNMSLGREGDCSSPIDGPDPTAAMIRAAIQALTGNGVPVVVAAGNDNTKDVKDMVPAGCPDVLAVASSTAEDGNSKCKVLPDPILRDTASFFTTDGTVDAYGDGPGVTISAPGEAHEDLTCGMVKTVGILSTAMGGGTVEKSGTSMAAPHVTGVVALMLEAAVKNEINLSPADIRTRIRDTAYGQDATPLDNLVGTSDGMREGIICAPDAVNGTTGTCQ